MLNSKKSPATADVDPLPAYGDEWKSERTKTKIYAVDLYADDYDDPVYQAKARILNHAIQEIGMGKYQVRRKFDLRFVRPRDLTDSVW